jgi:hypothetical protein
LTSSSDRSDAAWLSWMTMVSSGVDEPFARHQVCDLIPDVVERD